MLKKKEKTFVKTLSLSILQVYFSVSSDLRSELHMQKRDPKMQMNMDKTVSDRFKCTIYTFQNCDINSFWEKNDSKHFLMHSSGTQLSKAETPWGSEELQSTYQGFLDINLHGIVIIAFELFICIWHQDWDPQLCRHCDEVNIIAIL